MAEITGIIQSIIEKQTSAGVMADIVVAGEKYGAGLKKFLKAKEGDYVKFELDDARGYKNVGRGSLMVGKGAPPADAVAAAAATKTKVAGAVSGFDARQDAISRQAASNTAIAYMTLLASQDALPKAKTKGAAASTLDAVREEYERVFYERNTGQVYKSIAPDTGPTSKAEDPEAEDAPEDEVWQ